MDEDAEPAPRIDDVRSPWQAAHVAAIPAIPLMEEEEPKLPFRPGVNRAVSLHDIRHRRIDLKGLPQLAQAILPGRRTIRLVWGLHLPIVPTCWSDMRAALLVAMAVKIAFATAQASLGGTAFPTCENWRDFFPANMNWSGKD